MKVYAYQNKKTKCWIGGIEWDDEEGYRLADHRRETAKEALADALEILERYNNPAPAAELLARDGF